MIRSSFLLMCSNIQALVTRAIWIRIVWIACCLSQLQGLDDFTTMQNLIQNVLYINMYILKHQFNIFQCFEPFSIADCDILKFLCCCSSAKIIEVRHWVCGIHFITSWSLLHDCTTFNTVDVKSHAYSHCFYITYIRCWSKFDTSIS